MFQRSIAHLSMQLSRMLATPSLPFWNPNKSPRLCAMGASLVFHCSISRSMELAPDGSGPRRVRESSSNSTGGDSLLSSPTSCRDALEGVPNARTARFWISAVARSSATNSRTIKKFDRERETNASRTYRRVIRQRMARATPKYKMIARYTTVKSSTSSFKASTDSRSGQLVSPGCSNRSF